MLNSIWLRQPYEFSPVYTHEVSSYLNATARTLTTAQQVNSLLMYFFLGSWPCLSDRVMTCYTASTALRP